MDKDYISLKTIQEHILKGSKELFISHAEAILAGMNMMIDISKKVSKEGVLWLQNLVEPIPEKNMPDEIKKYRDYTGSYPLLRMGFMLLIDRYGSDFIEDCMTNYCLVQHTQLTIFSVLDYIFAWSILQMKAGMRPYQMQLWYLSLIPAEAAKLYVELDPYFEDYQRMEQGVTSYSLVHDDPNNMMQVETAYHYDSEHKES